MINNNHINWLCDHCFVYTLILKEKTVFFLFDVVLHVLCFHQVEDVTDTFAKFKGETVLIDR